MSISRFSRAAKQQMGQFVTPEDVARRILDDVPLAPTMRILEPSFGDGSFLFAAIERLLDCHAGPKRQRLEKLFAQNLYGVELDRTLYQRFFEKLLARYDFTPSAHNLHCGDFFDWFPNGQQPPLTSQDYGLRSWESFDLIVGNPPFGGSIRADLQDALDAVFGYRLGENIKKETYSFFLVKSFDLLKLAGRLRFICSDTFLTINTMKGLRNLLMESGEVSIRRLDYFSDETTHPMVVVDFRKTNEPAEQLVVEGVPLPREDVEKTGNLSWRMTPDDARYFTGETIGDYLVASSGMTIGKNELFLRKIAADGTIQEPFEFEFFDEPITLPRELERARLGQISPAAQARIREKQRRGETRRNVRAIPLAEPRTISLPEADYCYYNKASSDIVYAPPRWVVYWKDAGDAVLTFKKNGNWYLHGVGGQPYFQRSGLTWPLISPRLCMKFLPAGYVLDSGAPCAFLREGVDPDELLLILGWSLTATCNRLLKNVINHTRNIQSKDFERLPYPAWISGSNKRAIIGHVEGLVKSAVSGKAFSFDHPEVAVLEEMFYFADVANPERTPRRARPAKQQPLFPKAKASRS